MKRREFVNLTSSLSMLALSSHSIFGKSFNTGGLVDTPQKRMEYTRDLLYRLCTEIGPRPSGTESFSKGAKILRDEMYLTLPEVNYDRYEFESWELVGDSQFIVGGQRIEAYPLTGCKGTPPNGIKGVLKKNGNEYTIDDLTTDEIRVSISISHYGKAITSYGRDCQTSIPSIRVGKQDVPLLDNAVRDKKPVFVKAITRYIPNAKGLNIVGKLPGKQKKQILFVAHADTVYNTPGANDNTASVIVMLMLAHAASIRNHQHTLTFVATDGEEFGYRGAKHLANKYVASDSLKDIQYVVNFDSLTYGPNLWISSQQEEVKDIVSSIHKDLNIKGKPIFDYKDGFVMDSAPFRQSGAKALHANSRGYDEKTLPLYHRPDDLAEDVPLDCVEIGFLVFNEYIKRIDLL